MNRASVRCIDALALLGLVTIQALHLIGDVTMLLGMAAYMLYRRH